MTDISLQPTAIIVQANTPIQVPVKGGGITIVNSLGQSILLCSDQNFTVPVIVKSGVSMPWTTGTTVWVRSPVDGTITVLPKAYNYYDPNVIPVPASPSPLFSLSEIAAGGQAYTVPINSSTRTLIIELRPPGGTTPAVSLQVTGVNSGQTYLVNTAPYLYFNSVAVYNVKVNPAVDTAVFVDPTFPTGPNSLSVFGDTDSYDDSRFYNGHKQVQYGLVTVGGSTAFLNGPCRLLTSEVESISQGAVALGYFSESPSGNIIHRAQAGVAAAGAADSVKTSIKSYPDFTIIPFGYQIILDHGGGAATVAGIIEYAYP